MIHDDTGAPMADESGIASMNSATIRVRSFWGNQYVRKRMIPGKKPASATPSRNRRV